VAWANQEYEERSPMALPETTTAILMGGIPAHNAALYHRMRFLVGDPTALIELAGAGGKPRTILILRDIELQRARQHARADQVACPADFTPPSGLSGDREIATAQAAAECLRRHGVDQVRADRSLPLLYAEIVRQEGILVECDRELGVIDRRAKDEQEIAWLQQSQYDTEQAMRMACEMIANAAVDDQGLLIMDGARLTAERVRAAIDRFLLDRGYANPPAIVAPGAQGADCHELGSGPIATGEPVIIDIFPRHRQTRYHGDCTRTVVHGTISEAVGRMHEAVLAAKQAAEGATRAGVTGEQVHVAVSNVMTRRGYRMGIPPDPECATHCAMTHGTGHGIGLDVHEPPLLDKNGPELVAGDALTIEPGLYCPQVGGVRVEDMVIVTPQGCHNLNTLPTGLDWRSE
jgi:Xaa-Pro aminopeptidase